MNLYFLRHGIAAELDMTNLAKDAERPLTAKGQRKLCEVAKAMKKMELSFDLILSSPYVRARQTAELVAKALRAQKRLVLSDTLIPDASTKRLVELLQERAPAPQEVLLVGHEPYLSGFISLLISGEPDESVAMKKGGLCKLVVEELRHGRCAKVEWLLTPKQMGLMV